MESRFLLEILLLNDLFNGVFIINEEGYHNDGNIPEDFWDPVVVSLDPELIKKIPTKEIITECINCYETKDIINTLECCKTDICSDCVNKWFSLSVYCPYCKKDLRTTANE
jgi:hypothetical protein